MEFDSTRVALQGFKLLTNIILITLYLSMFCTKHQPCLSQSSRNITDTFELSFLLGLVISIIDLLNTNLIEIIFSFKVESEEVNYGRSGNFSVSVLKWTGMIEKILRALLIPICYFQYMTVYSKFGDYCVTQLGVLELEGRFLLGMVIFQLGKALIFTLVEVYIAN